MRCAAVFLALLLCLYWTWARGESGGVTGNDVIQANGENKDRYIQTNITPDIWTELKELRDMAIAQKVELRYSKSKIEKLEQETTGDTNHKTYYYQSHSTAQIHAMFINVTDYFKESFIALTPATKVHIY